MDDSHLTDEQAFNAWAKLAGYADNPDKTAINHAFGGWKAAQLWSPKIRQMERDIARIRID